MFKKKKEEKKLFAYGLIPGMKGSMRQASCSYEVLNSFCLGPFRLESATNKSYL